MLEEDLVAKHWQMMDALTEAESKKHLFDLMLAKVPKFVRDHFSSPFSYMRQVEVKLTVQRLREPPIEAILLSDAAFLSKIQ